MQNDILAMKWNILGVRIRLKKELLCPKVDGRIVRIKPKRKTGFEYPQ